MRYNEAGINCTAGDLVEKIVQIAMHMGLGILNLRPFPNAAAAKATLSGIPP
jgi:hypothetical protein